MGLSDFSGGVQEALAEIIKERLEREEVARRMEQQKFENSLDVRGADRADQQVGLQGRRVSLDESQDAYTRERDAMGDQAAAAQAASLDEYVSGLPEHLQPVARGARFGINIKPHDVVNAPLTYEQEDARNRANTTFETDEEIRQARAAEAERRRTQQMTRPAAGANDPGQAFAGERGSRIVAAIDDLTARTDGSTAGMWGKLASYVWGTDAHDFAADLETLGANISFKELQEMRNASKTGGALGQVAIRELDLLESTLGSIRQSQSPEQLRANLQKAKQTVMESQREWEAAKAQYGGGAPAAGRMSGPGPGPAQRPAVVEYDYIDGKLVPRGGGM